MRGFKFLLLLFLIVGCEKKDFTKTPPKLHWDRDMCERCKMAISDRKFGVEAVGEDGKVYKFDDIGCLILWQKLEAPKVKFKKIWVKEVKTGEWIDGKEACYVKNYITPMGYGYGAKKEKGEECKSFDEVKKEIEKVGK